MQIYNSFTGFVAVGALSLAVALLRLTGRSIPLLSSYRAATVFLVVLGLSMCTFGAMGYAVRKSLLSPFPLLGGALGLLALSIGLLTIFNKTLPFIHGDREALRPGYVFLLK